MEQVLVGEQRNVWRSRFKEQILDDVGAIFGDGHGERSVGRRFDLGSRNLSEMGSRPHTKDLFDSRSTLVSNEDVKDVFVAVVEGADGGTLGHRVQKEGQILARSWEQLSSQVSSVVAFVVETLGQSFGVCSCQQSDDAKVVRFDSQVERSVPC